MIILNEYLNYYKFISFDSNDFNFFTFIFITYNFSFNFSYFFILFIINFYCVYLTAPDSSFFSAPHSILKMHFEPDSSRSIAVYEKSRVSSLATQYCVEFCSVVGITIDTRPGIVALQGHLEQLLGILFSDFVFEVPSLVQAARTSGLRHLVVQEVVTHEGGRTASDFGSRLQNTMYSVQ